MSVRLHGVRVNGSRRSTLLHGVLSRPHHAQMFSCVHRCVVDNETNSLHTCLYETKKTYRVSTTTTWVIILQNQSDSQPTRLNKISRQFAKKIQGRIKVLGA